MVMLKIIHILGVISWMAGLLYLPRLFVYHAGQIPGSETSAVFMVMERRLYRLIMRPAMVVTWVTGLALAWLSFGFSPVWLVLKLNLVAIMTIHHVFQGRWLLEFAQGNNRHSARFYRFQNEVPTLLMIGIVILVIAKPF